MLGTLAAVVALLTVLTLINIALLFAVIRRLRGVEQQHGAGSLADQLPAVGHRVAEFEASALDGSVLTSAEVTGTTDGADRLVAFVMTGCGPCTQFISTLQDGSPAGFDRTFFFITGDPRTEDTAALVAELSDLGRVAMLAEEGPVGPAVGGIGSYPTVLRISDGVVAAAGRKLDEVFPGVPVPAGR
ncbi:MAG: hypothetical protein HOV87_30395 [Catenulispora sp.]|nr:hypothetical protein [Catenulispora sp.]